MRALLATVLALLVLPAAAGAQVQQDLATSAQVIAKPAPLERTVRVTLTNNGPGTYSGAQHAWAVIQTLPSFELVAIPTGCVARGYGMRCDHGTNLAQGESRSTEFTVRYTNQTDFSRDQIYLSGRFDDGNEGQPQYDPDPSNNDVTLDLGIERPPPSLKFELRLHRIAQHGRVMNYLFSVTNTGGHTLTDVRVTDDRCPSLDPSGPVELAPQERVGFVCTFTVPAHRRDERPLTVRGTVTAKAGDLTLTDSALARAYFYERQRKCGAIFVGGQRFDVTSNLPSSCRRARRRVGRCLRSGRDSGPFKCSPSRSGAVLVRPQPVLRLMRATRA